MDTKPEVIRDQIEQTRESLTDKLEDLENHVKRTVENVTGTVEHTVETVSSKVEGAVEAVTSTVHSTVEGVKETLDIPTHTRRHPYAMTGGAFVLGLIAGWWTMRPRRHTAAPRRFAEQQSTPHDGETRTGWFSNLMTPLTEEIGRFKGTAVGFLFGMARDALLKAVPESLVDRVRQIADDMTRRAGGEVMPSPVLAETRQEGQHHYQGERPPAHQTNP
jgi:hypothetical protein